MDACSWYGSWTYCPCAQETDQSGPCRTEKKHYFVAIPAIGAIVVAAGVIGKVAVADRLVKMSEAQSAASELQKQVDDITAYIDSFGDLQETYAHYTYQGLNADELSYLNRPEVLQLMKNVIFRR